MNSPGQELRQLMGKTSVFLLSVDTGIAETRLEDILEDKVKIGAWIDERLSAHFNQTQGYWIDLQQRYDRFLRES